MQNDDEVLNGQSQEGGLRRKEDCQMVHLQDGHLQHYYRALAHAS